MTADATDTPATQEAEETQEKPAKEIASDQEPSFADHDPRKSIYAMSDAVRFKTPSPTETQEEIAEEKVEESPKSEDEGKKPEEEAAQEPAAKEEEEPTPREKRIAKNLADKEKRLSAWEAKLVDQFKAAAESPKPKT